MVATLTAVREAMKTRLATLSTDDAPLHCHARMPDATPSPFVFVVPTSDDFNLTFDQDSGTLQFEVVVGVATTPSLEHAQEALDAYLAHEGALSIRALWWADRTWGGTVDDSILRGWRDYGIAEVAGQPFLTAKFDLECTQ